MQQKGKPYQPAPRIAPLPRYSLGGAKLTGDPKDRATRHQWIRLAWAAYSTARKTTYGTAGRNGPPPAPEVEFCTWDPATGTTCAYTGRDDGGAMEHWPHYAKLEAAALEMHELGISPQAFAEWSMEQAKAQDVARGRTPKPRPVTAVFSLKTLRQGSTTTTHSSKGVATTKPTRLAMFQQANGGNYGHVVKPTPRHLEQMYRLREVQRRKRGIESLVGMDARYVAIRQPEIDAGITDPMVCFPR